MALAIISPISVSPLAEMVPTCATASVVVTLIEISSSFLTIAATVLSIPFLISIGLAPAATFFNPSRAMALLRQTLDVVPSPATSFVFDAAATAICAPLSTKGSSILTSFATETPSLVTTPVDNITFLPDGPNVLHTASANMLIPSINLTLAFSLNNISFAIIFYSFYKIQ